jgi:hypothetical protein
MRSKVLLMSAILMASMLVMVVSPVEAALPPEAYEITKYDPMDDVMRVRTGGDFKFTPHNNIEIKQITSAYDDSNPVIPKIELKMTVQGQIKNHDDYKYAFTVIADGSEYILAAYKSGVAAGFEMDSSEVLIGVTASGENTDTLTISCPISEIGSPDRSYDFFGAALYSADESERFVDLAPDKLILITEPSDGSTVSGTTTVEGVIRQYDSGMPSGNVKISIDGGTPLDVTGSDPWSYPLVTTSLSEGPHTIYAEIEGTSYSDEITITVDQNTASYESFSKSDNRYPNVGDYYEYTSVGDSEIVGISLSFANEMNTQVTDLTEVEGEDVYQVDTHSEGEQNLGFARYSNTIDRISWKETTNLGTVKENTNSSVEVDIQDDTDVITTTIYDPPLDNHNELNVKVGYDFSWAFHTTADAESDTYVAGEEEPTHNSYNEPLDLTGECLSYLGPFSVNGNNFNDIYLIRSYYENPGVSIVEYYSPEFGIPVQIETYDASRKLLFSLGVDKIEQIPFSVVIDGISFDPSTPKAGSDNDVTVTVKNVGTTDASNVKVTLYDGDREVGEETISSIAEGQSADQKIKWKPTAEGSHSIRVTLSYQSTVLAERTVPVTVEKGSNGDNGDPIPLVLILIIIVVVVLVVVLLIKAKGKKEGEVPPAEAETAEAEAAPVEAAAAGGVVVASEAATPSQPAATPAAQSQINEETIQCPSCKKGFSIQYESKPVKVKCPNCGMEGVLS